MGSNPSTLINRPVNEAHEKVRAYRIFFFPYNWGMKRIYSEVNKEYNRNRARVLYDDFRIRKDAVNASLGGCCYLCGRIPSKQGLQLHHVERHPTESAYPRHSNAMSVRIKRLEEAERNPDRFRLLCGTCHRSVEALKRNHVDHKRLLELVI